MIRTSAWALVQAGVAPDAIRSLADLVTRQHFQLILQDLWNRTGETKTATLGRRADVLIAMARHHHQIEIAAAAHRIGDRMHLRVQEQLDIGQIVTA